MLYLLLVYNTLISYDYFQLELLFCTNSVAVKLFNSVYT